MAPQINLKTMAVNKLIALRGQIDAMLKDKVAEQRRVLQSELVKLDRIGGNPKGVKRTGASGRGSRVAPKYRNPDNPDQTWAGRGLQPRWLTAALKAMHLAPVIDTCSPGRHRCEGGDAILCFLALPIV